MKSSRTNHYENVYLFKNSENDFFAGFVKVGKNGGERAYYTPYVKNAMIVTNCKIASHIKHVTGDTELVYKLVK